MHQGVGVEVEGLAEQHAAVAIRGRSDTRSLAVDQGGGFEIFRCASECGV